MVSKIVFLSDLWQPFPGGAERFMFNIAKQMVQRGHSVVALCSYWKAEDTPGIKVSFRDIGVRSQSERRHEDGSAIITADIKAMQPDVIITHGFFAREFKDELEHLHLHGTPLIEVVHNGFRMAACNFAIFNSDYTRTHSNPQPQDMTIIPPAFEDIDAFTLPTPGIEWCPSRPYIGFIKPIQHKGIDFLYQIADSMPERRFLVLRGEWNLIEDIRQKPNVEFMESVKEMREFYRHVRLMLVPSLYEDAGTVPQESAINGIPCISSNIMGLNETNAAGVRLPMNLEMWVNAIRALEDAKQYQEVEDRQRVGLESFQWPQKFDELSSRIIELGGKP